MSEPFLGIITVCAFDYAPRGWALCDGQLLSITQNQALYALVGNLYGGASPMTFGLPDLRGRATVTASTPGHLEVKLTPRILGSQGGEETVPLTTGQIPSHGHYAYATARGDKTSPAGNIWSGDDNYPLALYAASVFRDNWEHVPMVKLNPRALQATGGGQPHPNISPFTVMNYIIALEGHFPGRN